MKEAMTIPDIVKEYVLKHCKRMPETQAEIDDYLDLINHGKKYQTALMLEQKVSKKFLKKLGFQTSDEIKKINPLVKTQTHEQRK